MLTEPIITKGVTRSGIAYTTIKYAAAIPADCSKDVLLMDEEKDLGDGGLGSGHWLEDWDRI